MRRSLAATPLAPILLAASLACRPAAPAPAPAPAGPAPATLDVEALRADVLVLAADSLGGRATGSRGAALAATYLAARAEAAGLEPAGDSGFFQRVPFVRFSYGAGTRFEVLGPGGSTPMALGADLVPLPALGRGTPPPRLAAEGDVVYLGYVSGAGAVPADSVGDVAGKVLVLVNGAPPGTPAGERAPLEAEARIGPRLRELVRLDPAAIVVLGAGKSAQFVDQLARRVANAAAGEDGSVVMGVPDSARTLPLLLLGRARAGSPLLPDGWPAGARPGAIPGRRFRARVDNAFNAVNVVGLLRGRDPALAATYVAFGAHYDHIGIARGAPGDTVNNGADDDASGSAGLLAIARRFAAGERPRRSLLFVWHVAEEVGLLGSEWFAAHPTVPIDSVVAQLNADMIGRNAPDSLYVVGPSAAPNGQSRALGAVFDSVNAASAQPFLLNREWDSPKHPEQIYFRSDHYNYARRGVPILFLTTGLHADYHQPSDEVEKLDFEKLARVSALMYQVGRAVAERSTRAR